MNKTRIVAAVDIGSYKITTLIAQVNTDQVTFEESVNIVGVATAPSKGVKRGQIVNIEDAVEATIVSVEAAERMAGYNLDNAFVAVGGGHIDSQNSTGVVAVSDPDGEVSPEDVMRVIEAARAVTQPTSREVIHVIPREYIVDGETGIRDPVGMSGVRLEVETHMISASAAALKNLSKTIHEVGVDIEELVFTGLAASYAVLTETEKELGCVLVDIGGETTSVAAFVENSLVFSGAIPIGSRNVTSDLAIGLRVSLDAAEKIKLKISEKGKDESNDQINLVDFGINESKKISKRTIVEGIIRPRLNEIFSMVKLDLERANLINKIPSGGIITGGGALTVGIHDSAKRTLSLPVRIGEPVGVSGLVDDVLNPQFAAPVGLILYGVGSLPQPENINSLTRKIKLPTKGAVGKLMQTIKDLLP